MPSFLITSNKVTMQGKKRRPTSSSKTHRLRTQGGSHVSQAEVKQIPSPSQLISKKYYQPVIKQQQRHQAYLLTRFLVGSRSNDQMRIAQLIAFYNSGQKLSRYYQNPQATLNITIFETDQKSKKIADKPLILSKTYELLRDNKRRKRSLLTSGTSCKKDDLKSTQVQSKKELNNILGNNFKLNDSQQLTKLQKYLHKIIKINNPSKGYKTFKYEMQKKSQNRDKEQDMINMILNLQKDFSSIQQDQFDSFSNQSIYGLSDLKKKNQKNSSKIENKQKDKNYGVAFCNQNQMQFMKKRDHHIDRSANSSSKYSGKSISVRKHKKGIDTPDNHRVKSKSKSTTKKTSKNVHQKKSKLTDTQKLYYDEVPQKIEQKESKLMMRQISKKGDTGMGKLKKKGLKS